MVRRCMPCPRSLSRTKDFGSPLSHCHLGFADVTELGCRSTVTGHQLQAATPKSSSGIDGRSAFRLCQSVTLNSAITKCFARARDKTKASSADPRLWLSIWKAVRPHDMTDPNALSPDNAPNRPPLLAGVRHLSLKRARKRRTLLSL